MIYQNNHSDFMPHLPASADLFAMY